MRYIIHPCREPMWKQIGKNKERNKQFKLIIFTIFYHFLKYLNNKASTALYTLTNEIDKIKETTE